MNPSKLVKSSPRPQFFRGRLPWRAATTAVFLAGSLQPLRAEVTLARVFGDHAVFQRERPVVLWGTAAPGETLEIVFKDQTVRTKGGPDGKWRAQLAPLAASAEPAELRVKGSNTVILRDILVGEVWLCSGQSNMERPVSRAANAKAEIAAAGNPLIRQLDIPNVVDEKAAAAAPQSWAVCSPDTVGAFTAVGYYFARDIAGKLKVPIGLINCTWGGTVIEAWMSPESLQGDPAFAVVEERWKKAVAEFPERMKVYEKKLAEWNAAKEQAKAEGRTLEGRAPRIPDGPGSKNEPSALYRAMLSPLIPYSVRGVLWYQGEQNSRRAGEYGRLFRTMITDWRQRWGLGEMPFLFVQLPNYRGDGPQNTSWAELREAQASALSLPATGMAVTIDIGDPNDIHPMNKQDVGKRLALVAGAHVYGLPGEWSGPQFERAEVENGSLRVHFSHTGEQGEQLVCRGKSVTGLEVAGADRQFHPAVGKIEGGTLVVSSSEVPSPVAVRYAWRNVPEVSLYNASGLPAAPFRSDDW